MADLLKPYISSSSVKTWADRSFQAVAPRLWNALLLSLHCLNSVDVDCGLKQSIDTDGID